jgi:hypothetical protein
MHDYQTIKRVALMVALKYKMIVLKKHWTRFVEIYVSEMCLRKQMKAVD